MGSLNSRFDTVIGDSHLGSGNANAREGHFEAANENLARALRNDAGLADRIGFTDAQVAELMTHPVPTRPPTGFTWRV